MTSQECNRILCTRIAAIAGEMSRFGPSVDNLTTLVALFGVLAGSNTVEPDPAMVDEKIRVIMGELWGDDAREAWRMMRE